LVFYWCYWCYCSYCCYWFSIGATGATGDIGATASIGTTGAIGAVKTRIKGNLEILDAVSTYLNVKDYLNFKGIKSSHIALKVDSTSKLFELEYYDRHFQDSTDADGTKTNKFRLKLKTDGGIIEDANGFLIDVIARVVA